jgi:hypothetical protein
MNDEQFSVHEVEGCRFTVRARSFQRLFKSIAKSSNFLSVMLENAEGKYVKSDN